MKKLSLLLGLTLASTSLFSQNSIKKLYPDQYVTIIDTDTKKDSFSFVLRPYDLSDDFKPDLWKIYKDIPSKEFLDSLDKFSSTDYLKDRIPDGYILDLNGDGEWNNEPWLINREKDIPKPSKYLRISSKKEIDL